MTLKTIFALCAATAMALPAQETFTTLHSFDSTDGANPGVVLIQATNGALYGTASSFGANGAGTVFKMTPGGTLTTVYNFCSESGCMDGVLPEAGLLQATSGDFYGTTNGGGLGYGTVFKITPGGTLTTLYSFCSQSGCADGANPFAGLVQGANGDFYGTARNGGANSGGTVFEITPTGRLTTMHKFCSQNDCTDGSNPLAALVEATDGDLYDNQRRRDQRPWDGLQNHPERHTHDAAQLRQDRRQRPRSCTGPGHRRELLRDNE